MLDKISSKLESKIDDYALLLTITDETMIKYANSQPSVTQSWNTYELNLYLIKNKKSIIVGLRNPNEKDLDLILESSLNKLEKMKETELLPEFPSIKAHDNLSAFDKKIIEVQNNLDSLLEIISSRTSSESELAGMVSLGKKEVILKTSSGFTGKHINT